MNCHLVPAVPLPQWLPNVFIKVSDESRIIFVVLFSNPKSDTQSFLYAMFFLIEKKAVTFPSCISSTSNIKNKMQDAATIATNQNAFYMVEPQ